MIRSMYSAVSGLRNHQTMMDVVGNNVANVNTTGFKSSTTVFQDVLSQVLRGAGLGNEGVGGTNPSQVGLGSRLSGVTTNFGQGDMQRTGRSTDFAIQGDGFFITEFVGQQLFTRAGSFSVDSTGRLTTQEGALVQGWQADATGVVNTNAAVTNLIIPIGDLIAPVQTGEVNVGGNLPSDAANGTTIANSVQIFDAQGNATNLRLEYTKTAANTWDAVFRYTDTAGVLQPTPPAAGSALTGGTLTFGANGELTSGFAMTIPGGTIPGFGAGDPITVSLGAAGAPNRLTQFGSVRSASILTQDGSAAGSLQGFTVSQEGLMVGAFSNGRTRSIGQLAVATFANPEGLEKAGQSSYRTTVNSGLAQIGTGAEGGRGLISSGTLEMSNVDLANEFTSLIIAQRGFQANSRVVTTSDEMLQEVVNLKR